MAPFSPTFEGMGELIQRKDKKVTAADAERNEKVAALSDHVDYAEKMATWKQRIQDMEEGRIVESFQDGDKSIGIGHTGDAGGSIFAIKKNSPLFLSLEEELLANGYTKHKDLGTDNVVYSKILKTENPGKYSKLAC